MGSLYRILKMRSYRGLPSKWLDARSGTWAQRCRDAFGGEHLVYSTHVSSKTNRRNQLPFTSRCLPFTGMSSAGLLVVLCRWSFAEKFVGGLDDPSGEQQAGSLDILRALIKIVIGVVRSSSWVAPAIADPHWSCRWPRPEPMSDRELKFDIQVNQGGLDFSRLFALASDEHANRTLKSWGDAMRQLFGQNDVVPLLSFLQQAYAKKALESLYNQVIHHCSLVLEKHMGQFAQNKLEIAGCDFSWQGLQDSLEGKDLGLRLAQYVVCTREMLGDSIAYGFCNDKGSVNRLPLRNGYIVIPGGQAGLCAPVVPKR